MCSLLQLAAFFYVCCLIRDVATLTKQNKDRKLSKESLNPTNPGVEDFYFVGEKGNDDIVKNGRPVLESSSSKQDNEQSLPVEYKAGAQFNDDFSIKNILFYLLNVVQELKKDIFGIKEIASFKNTIESENYQDNFEGKRKQNKPEENIDETKSVDSIVNTDFKNENQQTNSNYLTDYYQNNNITFIDDEENDDYFENFSDMSDDSSHQPNDEAIIYEVSKNNENARTFKSSEVKRKSEKYFLETEKITYIPVSQTKTPQHDVNQNLLLSSKEKAAHDASSEIENNMKRNKNYINHLSERTVSAEKSLDSSEFKASTNPPEENSEQEGSEKSNHDKTNFNKYPGKNSKDLDFKSKPGVLVQSTSLSPQSLRDVTFPDGNEPNASEASVNILTIRKQHKLIPSSKPGDKKRTQNSLKMMMDSKILENSGGQNELTPITNDSFKESERKTIYTLTTVTYNEKESNLKTQREKTSNSFGILNTITPSISEKGVSKKNLNKDTSNGVRNKSETNGNNGSEKPSVIKKNETDSENKKLNEDFILENSLKNKNLYDSFIGNNGNEESKNLTSTITNKLTPSDSIGEIQNHKIKGSNKYQEVEENKNLTESSGIQEISPDQEYEYEEDNADFDVFYELNDAQEFNQNEEELSANNEHRNDSGEINSANITTDLTNESQMSQHTGYAEKEKPQQQYDTFLEYFYKNSNSSYFQSLKNQSNNFPQKDEH